MFSTAHKGRDQSSSRSARTNTNIVNMCSMRRLTGLMSTTGVMHTWLSLHLSWWLACLVWNRHILVRWCRWSSCQFSEWSNAFHWHPVNWYLCDAKKWKCESVRTTYWLHTCDNGIVFWEWKPSVATSASISDSAFVYYRFKCLIVGIADIWSTGPGFGLPACVRIMTMS